MNHSSLFQGSEGHFLQHCNTPEVHARADPSVSEACLCEIDRAELYSRKCVHCIPKHVCIAQLRDACRVLKCPSAAGFAVFTFFSQTKRSKKNVNRTGLPPWNTLCRKGGWAVLGVCQLHLKDVDIIFVHCSVQ
jgi:hypothetical protein